MSMTADTETHIDPKPAKEMAAPCRQRLPMAKAPGAQSLLRIEPRAGPGAGKPIAKQIEEATDIYSFLFWQLGVKP